MPSLVTLKSVNDGTNTQLNEQQYANSDKIMQFIKVLVRHQGDSLFADPSVAMKAIRKQQSIEDVSLVSKEDMMTDMKGLQTANHDDENSQMNVDWDEANGSRLSVR